MIKSILVHLNDSAECDARLRLAKHLRVRFDAQISGLYFSPATFSMRNKELEYTDHFDNIVTMGKNVHAMDKEKVAREKVAIQHKLTHIFAEDRVPSWNVFKGSNAGDLIETCFYHDLIVLSNTLNFDHLLKKLSSEIATVASESGCPVCVIPKGFSGDFNFYHPVVVWDTSRASARAVSDALPFLQEARQVTVYCDPCTADDPRWLSGQKRLTEYLSLHNVAYNLVATDPTKQSFDSHLLDQINSTHHDLVVMGAYDHNNVKEVILGSMTRRVIQHSRVPVLLSH